MDLCAVAAVLEEAASIARCQRVESLTDRLHKCLATCPSSPQQRLELGKRFFDGIEIGGVGRQVDEFAAALFQELPKPRVQPNFVASRSRSRQQSD
jgi:hypothetical protein